MTDILIFSGQSNMQGQTESDPMDKPVAGASEYRLLTDSFVPLKNPVGEDIGELLLALSRKNQNIRHIPSAISRRF